MDKRLIVFVCTGNICRSPMGEYLLKDRLGPDSNWDVCSAGTSAVYGMRGSQASIDVLEKRGIDMSAHLSSPLDMALIDAASLIVVMTSSHRRQIDSLNPGASKKMFLMKSFDPDAEGDDVEDPIGLSIDVYGSICMQIEASLPGLMDFMERMS